MKNARTAKTNGELEELCATVRSLVSDGDYELCTRLICQAMECFPHAPHPHNLLGIVLENTGDHLTAMKHFRAAWALDPTYLPASHNLNTYGTFFSSGRCAFDESDVSPSPSNNMEIRYDQRGIGRAVRR